MCMNDERCEDCSYVWSCPHAETQEEKAARIRQDTTGGGESMAKVKTPEQCRKCYYKVGGVGCRVMLERFEGCWNATDRDTADQRERAINRYYWTANRRPQ